MLSGHEDGLKVMFSFGNPPREWGEIGVGANIFRYLYARLDECVANIAWCWGIMRGYIWGFQLSLDVSIGTFGALKSKPIEYFAMVPARLKKCSTKRVKSICNGHALLWADVKQSSFKSWPKVIDKEENLVLGLIWSHLQKSIRSRFEEVNRK